MARWYLLVAWQTGGYPKLARDVVVTRKPKSEAEYMHRIYGDSIQRIATFGPFPTADEAQAVSPLIVARDGREFSSRTVFMVAHTSLLNPPQFYVKGRPGAVHWTMHESLSKRFATAISAWRMAKKLEKVYKSTFRVISRQREA